MNWRKGFPVLLMVSAVLYGAACMACTCDDKRSVDKEYKQVDAVVAGTVVSLHRVGLSRSNAERVTLGAAAMQKEQQTAFEVVLARIVVDKQYKGNFACDTVDVYTGTGGRDCGFRFKAGDRYIVYGQREAYLSAVRKDVMYPSGEQIVWTYACLRTRHFFDEEERALLKAVKKNR